MRAGIVGLGLWVPDRVLRNDAWAPGFSTAFHRHRKDRRANDFTLLEERDVKRPYDELYVRHATVHENDPFKGAVERRIQNPEVPTAVGDAIAARRALEDARVRPEEVDLVLSSALVPDRIVPSNGPAIQARTGCVNAAALGVESYCSAPLAQLELAAGLIEAGRARVILCVQSHQIGRVNDMSLPFSPMFGDASAAFVVGRVPADRGVLCVVRGGNGALEGAVTFEYANPRASWWRDAAGPVHPGSSDLAGARHIGNHLLAYGIDTIRELCDAAAFPVHGAAAICMIQPLVWFQAAVAEGLGVPDDRAPSTHASYAHIGGAAVVANMMLARNRGLLADGAHLVLYAHGAGLTRYAVLLRYSDSSRRQAS